MAVKKGDNVLIITGKDSGKTGIVLEVLPDKNKVLVDGVNVVKRHTKPKNAQDKGGIISKPAPIDISNVMVVCPVCKKATRVAHAEKDGKKVRVCKKCNGALDKAYVKESKKEVKKQVKQTSKAKAETVEKVEATKATTKTAKTAKATAVKKETAKKEAAPKTASTKAKTTTAKATTKKSKTSDENK